VIEKKGSEKWIGAPYGNVQMTKKQRLAKLFPQLSLRTQPHRFSTIWETLKIPTPIAAHALTLTRPAALMEVRDVERVLDGDWIFLVWYRSHGPRPVRAGWGQSRFGRAILLHEARIATEMSLEAARQAQNYERLANMKLKRKPKDQSHD
jgi:hypothetical protein